MDDAANLNYSEYQLEKVLQVYFMQNAAYPKTLDEGLQGVPGMKFDPWGRPYHYLFPGKHNPNKYDLWSGGPDGTAAFGNWRGGEPSGNGPSMPTYSYQQFISKPSNETVDGPDQRSTQGGAGGAEGGSSFVQQHRGSDADMKHKLLGFWSSPRHDYLYKSDGVCYMVGGTTKSNWDVKSGVYFDFSRSYSIISLSDTKFVFRDNSNGDTFTLVRCSKKDMELIKKYYGQWLQEH